MKRFNDLGADRSKEWAAHAAAVTCSGCHMNIVQDAHEAAQAAAAISRSAHAAAVVVIMNTLLK